MSGTLSGLLGLFGNGGGLLQTAYGLGARATPAEGNPALALKQAERNRARDIARTAIRPEVARDVAAFRAGLARATTPEAALKDPAVLKVLLTANGLAEHIPHAALARKALLSDVSDTDSLANRLPDRRWKDTAATYDFAHKGLTLLRDPNVTNRLAAGYAEVRWRQELDAATPGLSDALSFRELATTATSALEILGHPILRRVVTTALGLPPQIAFQSVEAQEKAVTARLDVTRLQDPKFVETFAQRYLLARASQSGAATSRSAGLLV